MSFEFKTSKQKLLLNNSVVVSGARWWGGIERKAQSWTFVTTSTHKFSPNCLACQLPLAVLLFLSLYAVCCGGGDGVVVSIVIVVVIQVVVVGSVTVQSTVVKL